MNRTMLLAMRFTAWSAILLIAGCLLGLLIDSSSFPLYAAGIIIGTVTLAVLLWLQHVEELEAMEQARARLHEELEDWYRKDPGDDDD